MSPHESCGTIASRYRETSHSPVECTTLLRWSPLTGTEGSNPSVSASRKMVARGRPFCLPELKTRQSTIRLRSLIGHVLVHVVASVSPRSQWAFQPAMGRMGTRRLREQVAAADGALFVGRDRELGLIGALLAADARHRILLLHGEGGIGKSALLGRSHGGLTLRARRCWLWTAGMSPHEPTSSRMR